MASSLVYKHVEGALAILYYWRLLFSITNTCSMNSYC